jgi:hypothetical protein
LAGVEEFESAGDFDGWHQMFLPGLLVIFSS